MFLHRYIILLTFQSRSEAFTKFRFSLTVIRIERTGHSLSDCFVEYELYIHMTFT